MDDTYAGTGMANGFDPTSYREGFLDELKLDGFEVKTPSGRMLRPHTGQSIWLMPYGLSLAEEMKVAEFADLSRQNDDATAAERKERLDAAFDSMCAMLSRLIVGWNITDPHGQPYPQPSDSPDAIKAIPSRLFRFIVDALRGEEPEGNASGG